MMKKKTTMRSGDWRQCAPRWGAISAAAGVAALACAVAVGSPALADAGDDSGYGSSSFSGDGWGTSWQWPSAPQGGGDQQGSQQTSPQQFAPQQTSPQQTSPQQAPPQQVPASPMDHEDYLRSTAHFQGVPFQEYVQNKAQWDQRDQQELLRLAQEDAAPQQQQAQPQDVPQTQQQPLSEREYWRQNRIAPWDKDVMAPEAYWWSPEKWRQGMTFEQFMLNRRQQQAANQ